MQEIKDILLEVVRRSGLREAYVETIVTRGVPGPGERDPRKWTPRFYAYAIPYVWIVRPEQQDLGTDGLVARETVRIPHKSVDPTVKNFHWGDLVRGLFEAYDRDAWLPILTDGNGLVTEGPGFNVFASSTGAAYPGGRGPRGDNPQDGDRAGRGGGDTGESWVNCRLPICIVRLSCSSPVRPEA